MNNNTVSSDLIRGHIDTIILRSLYFGDRYGYDIIKEIEQKTDGEYQLKQPTLYSCLKRLEEQGFTSSYWGAKSMGGRKKYYTLTDMGRQLFIKNQTDWQRSRQIIEKLIEGDEFEINAARPRVFEKAFDDDSENIFDKESLMTDAGNQTATAGENADYISEEVAATNHPASHDETEPSGNFTDIIFSNSTPDNETTEKFDNFIILEETETEDQQRYDNFEAEYESDPDLFKNQERYDNFSDYVAPPPDPYKPALFIREQTDEDTAAYEAADAARQTILTRSSYELDQNGDYVNEFGPETDANELDNPDTTADTFYFDQKDKPSYIDDVSGALYSPKADVKTEDYTFLCEDELPYAEHLLKEYGSEQSESFDTESDFSKSDFIELDADNRNKDLTEKKIENAPESVSEEPCDCSELPPESAGDKNEAYEDDGIELPYSEPFKEPDKEDALIKSFLKYDNSSLGEIKDEEIIKREYHAALSRLIRMQKPKYSTDPFIQNKLEQTEKKATEMGDKMIVRKHTDTVKEYNSENYYYSSRLRLWQYGIMFILMLVQTAVTFAICELFIHKAVITTTELWIYIIGIIVSLALPAIAFGLAQLNLNKRKKADHDLKSLMIFRILLCALILLIIFLINSYLGILTSKFSDYLASLIYPMALATNIIISGLVFNGLYKSKKFKCQ